MKSILMCIGMVALLGGCDQSKAELDSTKSTLASVTQERDNLKTQNTQLQQQLDATKAELAKAKAPPAAPTATAATDTKKPDAKKPATAEKKHHKS